MVSSQIDIVESRRSAHAVACVGERLFADCFRASSASQSCIVGDYRAKDGLLRGSSHALQDRARDLESLQGCVCLEILAYDLVPMWSQAYIDSHISALDSVTTINPQEGLQNLYSWVRFPPAPPGSNLLIRL